MAEINKYNLIEIDQNYRTRRQVYQKSQRNSSKTVFKVWFVTIFHSIWIRKQKNYQRMRITTCYTFSFDPIVCKCPIKKMSFFFSTLIVGKMLTFSTQISNIPLLLVHASNKMCSRYVRRKIDARNKQLLDVIK